MAPPGGGGQSKARTVKALEKHPEPVHPARHSYLWRLSKFVKAWEQRWFTLDRNGFVSAKTPQGLSLCKPVFSGLPEQAWPEAKSLAKDGCVMFGLSIQSDEGDIVTLHSPDRALRDAWVHTINMAARARTHNMYINDRYSIDYHKPLGTGLFAVVLQGQELNTGTLVAIKVIKADAYKEYKDLIEREIMVWHAAGSHPHVVRLMEVLYSEHRVYFIAELCEGGNLMLSLAQRSTYCERDVASLMRQLVDAVQHCHKQGIVHCDLKPENIVLLNKSPDSPIKLIDFSLASFFHTSTEPGGTPEFVAPEVLIYPEHYAEKGCGPSLDCWAIGVILYYLLCGKTPFYAKTMDEIIERVKSGVWDFSGSCWLQVSEEAKDLIAMLLQFNPKARPSSLTLLDHPWFQIHPSRHRTNVLRDALKGFKAQFSNEGNSANQRMSWVRRTGIVGVSEQGQMGLAGQSIPEEHQGSAAHPELTKVRAEGGSSAQMRRNSDSMAWAQIMAQRMPLPTPADGLPGSTNVGAGPGMGGGSVSSGMDMGFSGFGGGGAQAFSPVGAKSLGRMGATKAATRTSWGPGSDSQIPDITLLQSQAGAHGGRGAPGQSRMGGTSYGFSGFGGDAGQCVNAASTPHASARALARAGSSGHGLRSNSGGVSSGTGAGSPLGGCGSASPSQFGGGTSCAAMRRSSSQRRSSSTALPPQPENAHHSSNSSGAHSGPNSTSEGTHCALNAAAHAGAPTRTHSDGLSRTSSLPAYSDERSAVAAAASAHSTCALPSPLPHMEACGYEPGASAFTHQPALSGMRDAVDVGTMGKGRAGKGARSLSVAAYSSPQLDFPEALLGGRESGGTGHSSATAGQLNLPFIDELREEGSWDIHVRGKSGASSPVVFQGWGPASPYQGMGEQQGNAVSWDAKLQQQQQQQQQQGGSGAQPSSSLQQLLALRAQLAALKEEKKQRQLWQQQHQQSGTISWEAKLQQQQQQQQHIPQFHSAGNLPLVPNPPQPPQQIMMGPQPPRRVSYMDTHSSATSTPSPYSTSFQPHFAPSPLSSTTSPLMGMGCTNTNPTSPLSPPQSSRGSAPGIGGTGSYGQPWSQPGGALSMSQLPLSFELDQAMRGFQQQLSFQH